MPNNKTKTKDKFMAKSIESHETAAWANQQDTQPVTNVNIPSQTEVKNAKDWVDSNEK